VVILMSLKAGGLGLNLVCCSNVFILDPWYSCLSVCVPLCLSASLPLCLSVSLSLCLSVSVSVPLPIPVPVSVQVMRARPPGGLRAPSFEYRHVDACF
jgi:hypothetical protein